MPAGRCDRTLAQDGFGWLRLEPLPGQRQVVGRSHFNLLIASDGVGDHLFAPPNKLVVNGTDEELPLRVVLRGQQLRCGGDVVAAAGEIVEPRRSVLADDFLLRGPQNAALSIQLRIGIRRRSRRVGYEGAVGAPAAAVAQKFCGIDRGGRCRNRRSAARIRRSSDPRPVEWSPRGPA